MDQIPDSDTQITQMIRSDIGQEDALIVAVTPGDKMEFDGWMSTESRDRSGVILPADGALPYWEQFRANPILLFQHDLMMPVGVCRNPTIVLDGAKRGLFGEGFKLAETRANREWLWPLVAGGAVRQMSIGYAFDLSRVIKDDARRAYVVSPYLVNEASLTPLALEPESVLEGSSLRAVRSLFPDGSVSMTQIMRAAYVGLLEKPKQIAVPENLSDLGLRMTSTTTTIRNQALQAATLYRNRQGARAVFEALAADDQPAAEAYRHLVPILPDLAQRFPDLEAEVKPAAEQAAKAAEEAALKTMLIPSQRRLRYCNSDGTPNLERLADAALSLAGARRSFELTEDEAWTALYRLRSAYQEAGWQAPLHDGQPIWEARALPGYQEIQWQNGEPILAQAVGMLRSLQELENLSKAFSTHSAEDVAAAFADEKTRNGFRAYVDLSIHDYASLGNKPALAGMAQLLKVLSDGSQSITEAEQEAELAEMGDESDAVLALFA